jgi:hypothetical protein
VNPLERFRALFRSDAPSHGYVQPLKDDPKGKAWTVAQPLKDEDFSNHLSGILRLGLVPTNSEGLSWFGAVDVDQHANAACVDMIALEAALKEFPVVLVQTRRKGAHVYLFGSEPLPTEPLRGYLNRIAEKCRTFGSPIEVFPKQGKLVGENQGQWINLPYFDAENGHCYAIHETQPLDLEEFLTLAESRRVTSGQLMEFAGLKSNTGFPEMSEAPPCLVDILNGQPIERGEQNNFLYNLTVLCNKAKFNKSQTMAALSAWNKTAFSPPVPQKDIADIIKRLGSEGEHNYLCDQAPICDHCDKEACGKRKLGWKKAVFVDHVTTRGEIAVKLQIVKSEPPKYVLVMLNGAKVVMDAEDIVNPAKVRVCVLQQADTIIPMLKLSAWNTIFQELFTAREFLPAPASASEDMAIVALLYDWCRQAEEVDGRGNPQVSQPDDLRKGGPIVMLDPDTDAPRTYFLPEHMERELKRRKVQGYTGRDMWAVLSRHGCTHEKLKNGVEAWSKPFTPYTPLLETPTVHERF